MLPMRLAAFFAGQLALRPLLWPLTLIRAHANWGAELSHPEPLGLCNVTRQYDNC